MWGSALSAKFGTLCIHARNVFTSEHLLCFILINSYCSFCATATLVPCSWEDLDVEHRSQSWRLGQLTSPETKLEKQLWSSFPHLVYSRGRAETSQVIIPVSVQTWGGYLEDGILQVSKSIIFFNHNKSQREAPPRSSFSPSNPFTFSVALNPPTLGSAREARGTPTLQRGWGLSCDSQRLLITRPCSSLADLLFFFSREKKEKR